MTPATGGAIESRVCLSFLTEIKSGLLHWLCTRDAAVRKIDRGTRLCRWFVARETIFSFTRFLSSLSRGLFLFPTHRRPSDG